MAHELGMAFIFWKGMEGQKKDILWHGNILQNSNFRAHTWGFTGPSPTPSFRHCLWLFSHLNSRAEWSKKWQWPQSLSYSLSDSLQKQFANPAWQLSFFPMFLQKRLVIHRVSRMWATKKEGLGGEGKGETRLCELQNFASFLLEKRSYTEAARACRRVT